MRFSALTRRTITALMLAVFVFSASTLAAQGPAEDKAEKMARLAATHAAKVMDVVIDKGVPLTLDAPAASIFIANPDVADVQVLTPTSIMVYGKKNGQTTLLISGDRGNILAHRTVMVSQNLGDLREALRAVIPNATIKVESVPGGIVLSGEVSDPSVVEDARRISARYVPAESGEIINRIKVKRNNQVEIRVRFAEVSRDVDKRLGINWENAARMGSFTFGLATGPDFYKGLGQSLTRTTIGDDLNNAISGSFNNSHFSVNAMIDALAKDGLVTVLAEPSLIAMSGETASFLAGGEFPIPVPQTGDTITIEWKQYGVSLAFTPTIIGDNRINLHVRPEVSQLSQAGSITLSNVEVPALTTRRAETTVELASGQSFAVAGLLNNNQTQSVSKFPLLGDMPVLGPLFRSSRFQNNESELVIIITPYIVKPSTPDQLALPTDGFKTPSEIDQSFKMRHTNSDANARQLSGEPRAVKVDPPIAPAPVAAPRSAVTPAPVPAPAPKSEPVKQSQPVAIQPAPAPVTLPPRNPAAGGFIVE